MRWWMGLLVVFGGCGKGRGEAGVFGTADPIRLLAADPEDAWVVACQARDDTDDAPGIQVRVDDHGRFAGDAMVPYLIRGGGAGEAIDAFVASSRDGRWIAVIRDDELRLIDARDDTTITLADADTRGDQRDDRHRAAAFDASGAHLVYLRRTGDRTRIVIRDLAQGREREVDPGGSVWRVEPDREGPWALVRTIVSDSDGNGRLEWPAVEPHGPSDDCAGLTFSYSELHGRGDHPTLVWLRLDTGQVIPARGTRPIDDVPLTITPGGGLVRGDERWIADGCAPRLIAVRASPPRALGVCAAATGAPLVELFGPGLRVALGPASTPDPDAPPAPLVPDPVTCGAPDACFDMRTGAPVEMAGPIRGESGDMLLVQGKRWWLYDAAAQRPTPLDVTGGVAHAQRGPIVAIDATIVDLEHKIVLGAVSASPLTVDRRGRGLVASSTGGERVVAIGPLRWETPK